MKDVEGKVPVDGYLCGCGTYIEAEGKALLHSDDVKTSDAIAVHLLDGTVKAVVSEVVKNE